MSDVTNQKIKAGWRPIKCLWECEGGEKTSHGCLGEEFLAGTTQQGPWSRDILRQEEDIEKASVTGAEWQGGDNLVIDGFRDAVWNQSLFVCLSSQDGSYCIVLSSAVNILTFILKDLL